MHIRGDQDARYEFVGTVVVACQRAGIAKVAFITEPPARASPVTAMSRAPRASTESFAMAMNVGNAPAAGEPDVMVDINTTPLIDVMLVLLIMLIITIPIQTHAVKLEHAGGNPPPPLMQPEVVRSTSISTARSLERHGRAGPGDAGGRLRAAAAEPVQPEIHLRPEQAGRRTRWSRRCWRRHSGSGSPRSESSATSSSSTDMAPVTGKQ